MAAAAQEQAPAGNERSVSLQKIDDFLSDRSVSSYLLGEGLTKEVILERVGLASDQQIAEAAAKVEAFRLARAERQREEPPQDAREREAKVKMMDSGADLLQATTVLTWIMIVMGVLLILLIL
ncbi:MAG: hypothetical protein A2V83_10315 [Nitrospirae bacterium RBG_16_64_22]|nr:MAG: hypothetical protein A2V83_10315 [Nitrospirae bacterium RBG_16_64_22]